MGDTLDARAMPSRRTCMCRRFYMDVNLVSYSQWQTVYN